MTQNAIPSRRRVAARIAQRDAVAARGRLRRRGAAAARRRARGHATVRHGVTAAGRRHRRRRRPVERRLLPALPVEGRPRRRPARGRRRAAAQLPRPPDGQGARRPRRRCGAGSRACSRRPTRASPRPPSPCCSTPAAPATAGPRAATSPAPRSPRCCTSRSPRSAATGPTSTPSLIAHAVLGRLSDHLWAGTRPERRRDRARRGDVPRRHSVGRRSAVAVIETKLTQTVGHRHHREADALLVRRACRTEQRLQARGVDEGQPGTRRCGAPARPTRGGRRSGRGRPPRRTGRTRRAARSPPRPRRAEWTTVISKSSVTWNTAGLPHPRARCTEGKSSRSGCQPPPGGTPSHPAGSLGLEPNDDHGAAIVVGHTPQAEPALSLVEQRPIAIPRTPSACAPPRGRASSPEPPVRPAAPAAAASRHRRAASPSPDPGRRPDPSASSTSTREDGSSRMRVDGGLRRLERADAVFVGPGERFEGLGGAVEG